MVPYHQILGSNLLEILYRSLNISFKGVADTIFRGALMYLCWDMAKEILDEISVAYRGWNTREANRGVGTYAIMDTINYRA